MSTKVQSVPNTFIKKDHRGAVRLPPGRNHSLRLVARAFFAASVLLLVGACSSKNPDALPGINVDENLAMMDANAAAKPNAIINNSSDLNSGPANASNKSSDARDAAVAGARARGSRVLGNREPPGQAKVEGTGAQNTSAEATDGDQDGNEDDAPNGG